MAQMESPIWSMRDWGLSAPSTCPSLEPPSPLPTCPPRGAPLIVVVASLVPQRVVGAHRCRLAALWLRLWPWEPWRLPHLQRSGSSW